MMKYPILAACAATFAAFAATPASAQSAGRPVWTTSITTGMADTFQLTLGGMFGQGPAWQNRLTTGLSNLLVSGDSVSIYGSDTTDTRDHINSWQAGIGYRIPLLKKRGHTVTIGSGLQRWLFPSVKTGAKDWLIPGNIAYQTKMPGKLSRFSTSVTGDSWSLLKSTLPTGSLLHSQGWLQYTLLKRDHLTITVKNGPAHTYSWNFYGTNGHRVIRYQTGAAFNFGKTTLEGGWRKQFGMQNGIAENKFWQFSLTHTFSHALR